MQSGDSRQPLGYVSPISSEEEAVGVREWGVHLRAECVYVTHTDV